MSILFIFRKSTYSFGSFSSIVGISDDVARRSEEAQRHRMAKQRRRRLQNLLLGRGGSTLGFVQEPEQHELRQNESGHALLLR